MSDELDANGGKTDLQSLYDASVNHRDILTVEVGKRDAEIAALREHGDESDRLVVTLRSVIKAAKLCLHFTDSNPDDGLERMAADAAIMCKTLREQLAAVNQRADDAERAARVAQADAECLQQACYGTIGVRVHCKICGYARDEWEQFFHADNCPLSRVHPGTPLLDELRTKTEALESLLAEHARQWIDSNTTRGLRYCFQCEHENTDTCGTCSHTSDKWTRKIHPQCPCKTCEAARDALAPQDGGNQ